MQDKAPEEVSDKIFTVPNIITFVRLLMIPLFLWLMFAMNQQLAALVVYAVAASTDWVDGQVARRTHQVSKLGKLMDPFVDRFLLAAGVIAVTILGRLPIWVLFFIIIRDLILLCESRYMLATVRKVPSVVYVGKFATAFLMFGFSFLLLGMPTVIGFKLLPEPLTWLPGLAGEPALLGVLLVYAGVICSVIAFAIYQYRGIKMFAEWKRSGSSE